MNQPFAEILTQLRLGNQSLLIDFYRENRDHFARWARQQHQLEPTRAHELLRAALVQFYDQVLDGRITKLPASMRDYVYEMAVQPLPAADSGTAEVLPAAEAGRRRRLVLLFRQLSSDSQKILMYFYFRGYNFVKVAGKMGYPNAAVARRQKLSSVRTLYELYQRSSGATPA